MRKPPLNPDIADVAPTDPTLTPYDEQHLITYLRLLDADAEGADWREVAKIVLHIDPDREPERATPRLREPSGAGQVDDRTRISAFAARRRAKLKEIIVRR